MNEAPRLLKREIRGRPRRMKRSEFKELYMEALADGIALCDLKRKLQSQRYLPDSTFYTYASECESEMIRQQAANETSIS